MDELDMLIDYHKDVGLAASAYLAASVLTTNPRIRNVYLDLSGEAMKIVQMTHALIDQLGGTVH